MSAVHGVVILADQRWEAPIIQAIQSRSDCLAIVRRCADLAEVIAAARAGIADLAVIDGAGHYPHTETPDQVVALLLPFLRRTVGAGAADTTDTTGPRA